VIEELTRSNLQQLLLDLKDQLADCDWGSGPEDETVARVLVIRFGRVFEVG
jgi:hypothetical protein